MPDIQVLQQELEQTIQKREDIRGKHTGAILPDDARREDAQLTERAEKLMAAIEQEKQVDRDRKMEAARSYMDDPVYQISHPVDADNEGRKMLEKAGWETKDGMVTRMTSMGVEVKMYPQDVLWGPLPTDSKDNDVAAYMKQTRAIFQPSYRRAYLKYLTAGSRKEPSVIWASLTSEEQKSLSEGTDSAGGYLVPPDIQAELLARTAQDSVFRQKARVVPTSRDKLVFPRVQAASATASGLASGGGSVFSSGFIGSWAGETPAFSSTDPAFGTFEIPIKKLRVASKLSNDFLSDAVINVASWLAQNGGENMALVEDQGFLTGNGAGLQPKGILSEVDLQTSGASAVDVEGTTANTLDNSTSSTGAAPKIITLVYSLPAQYANRAQWMMRRATEGKVRKLVDGQGRYLWPLQSGSMFGAPNGVGARTLLEYPIANSDFMPADGTDTNQVLLFGDFSAYIIAQRTAISTVVLRERFADTDETGIIIWERVGGACWNTDAFRCGVV